jgi:KH domain
MAEDLGLAARINAVVDLGDRVVSLSCPFIGKVQGAEGQIITTITALNGFLEFLPRLATNDENASRLPQLILISQKGGPLDVCAELLKVMESKLQPERECTGVLKAITWPFKWKEIGQVFEVIERQKALIMRVLAGDTTQATLGDRTAEGQSTPNKHPAIDLLKIPPAQHCLLLANGGQPINQIREQTGCTVDVPKEGDYDDTIIISGSRDGVEKAKKLIMESVENRYLAMADTMRKDYYKILYSYPQSV